MRGRAAPPHPGIYQVPPPGLRGSGPKETSSSLISTILKRGKFTYNKVVPKLNLNCVSIEAEVKIQFSRRVMCDNPLKISRRDGSFEYL